MGPRSGQEGGFGALKGRLAAALSTGALLALALAPAANASTDVLDQSEQILTGQYQALTNMAETFTPSTTGQLDRVSLYSGTTGFAPATFYVEIWTVAAGQPAAVDQLNGTTKASTPVTAFLGTPTWHDFALSHAVPLTGGTQYAIVVRNSGNFRWSYENYENYAGGKLWLSSGGPWMSGVTLGLSFDFKTWMSTSVNQAPTVAAANATVSVGEGTASTNTGTYSDPDGDTVSVKASTGSLTNSGGTWSWSEPASDEGSSQTVTVTADDGKGLTATTTFTVNVSGVAPAPQISPTFSSSPEGTTVSLSASATSPDADDNKAGFAYTWSASKDGAPYSSGSGPSFSVAADDEGTFKVTLSATDDGGLTGSTTLTFNGANVAPTANISAATPSAPLVLTVQEPVAFSGSFIDPGVLDSHTAAWDFGDGTSGTGFSTSHAYSAAGTYTVTLTVTDDDGGSGQVTTQVTVQTPQAALSTIAGDLQGISTLNAGQKNSLLAKLNAASAAAGRGDATAANNQLVAFLNELQADVNTDKISPSAASDLRNAVNAVQAALGTFNRFLGWWPPA
jgi:PKD repeat protein